MEALIRTSELADIYDKVRAGVRLSREDGLRLYEADDLPLVGYAANLVRERMNGNVAYYVRNQHINYTNVCNKLCKFCSFYVPPKDERGYVLYPEDIKARLLQHIDLPITEVHMVAGINPKLPYQYYLDILDAVREVRPEVHIKAFTMIELAQIQRVAKKPMRDVLLELKAHGLSSLPGGGAEVF
ncbi:aminofutalosine synthase MqnE, partial [bacterium]|nr:aminofutalosine synthase MqnE [bacterium]